MKEKTRIMSGTNKIGCYWLFVVAFLVYCIPIEGRQILFYVPKGLSVLGSNTISSIDQDQTGFMWMSTPTGLYRYDGYRLKKYYTPNSTASYQGFKEVHVDGGNNMWVRNYNTTYIYNKEYDMLTQQGDSLLQSLSIRGKADHLMFDQERNLWCQQGNTLNYYRFEGKQHLHCFKTENTTISKVAASETYRIALATDGTLYRISNSTLQPILHLDVPANPDLLMYIDSKQRLWISASPQESKIMCVDLKQETLVDISLLLGIPEKEYITGIGETNGELWIATNNQGVLVLDEGDLPSTHCKMDYMNMNSLPTNCASSMLVLDGIVWVGTKNHGLVNTATYNQNAARITVPEPSIINTLVEDKQGRLWVGYENKGLQCISPDGNYITYNSLNGLPNSTITGSTMDKQGRLWFYSYGGSIFREEDGSFITPPAVRDKKEVLLVAGAVFDKDDNLWIATSDHGVYGMTRKGKLRHIDSNNSDFPTDFLNTITYNPRNQLLYVGTSIGLFALHPHTGKVTYIDLGVSRDEMQKETPVVNAIYADNNGNTWVGTDQGIYVLSSGNHILNELSEKNGLACREVKSILADHRRHVWIGGSTGYSCINLTNKRLPRDIISYGRIDGIHNLVPTRNAITLTHEGNILIGSEGFYLRVNQPIDTKPGKMRKAIFTQLLVDGQQSKSLCVIDEITLSHSNINFSIEVSAMNYDYRNPSVFRYRLSNNDSWIMMAENSIEFNHLPAGEYNIEVQSRQNDGSFGDSTILHLHMLPPWWWSLPAKIVYTLFCVIAIACISIHLRRKQIQKLANQRMQMEREQERKLAEVQTSIVASMADDSLLGKVNDLVAQHITEVEYSVEQLSQDLEMSRSGLYKKLLAITGKTPLEYIHILRVKRGKEIIDDGETSVSQVAYQVGLSPKQFSKYYKEIYGMLPSEHLRGNEETKISM